MGNLLDLSRLEAGVIQPEFFSVRILSAVHDALSSLGPARDAFEITSIDANLEVIADAVLLERVLANIASNAIRHGASSGALQIQTRRHENSIDIVISDHGPGMSTEDRTRAFEPFTQLGDRAGGAGTGLGLAVASGFIEAMNGSIILDDTEGGGLTVVMTLASPQTFDSTRSQKMIL